MNRDARLPVVVGVDDSEAALRAVLHRATSPVAVVPLAGAGR